MSALRSTSKALARCLAILLAAGLAPAALADDHRARVNYTLYCQGCHLADATGLGGEVPRMKDFVGYFLHSKEGREFIIRVPGVATASLPDDDLAELINWLLRTYSGDQLPARFEPFSASEVGALRSELEPQPQAARKRILAAIARTHPELARELNAAPGR